jgi:diguanylate cyclase (GGDEF)-like protein/PAS domain S-box-containing protein
MDYCYGRLDATSLATISADVVAAHLSALLVRRAFPPKATGTSTREIIWLIVWAALFSSVIDASLKALATAWILNTSPTVSAWRMMWTADALGVLVATPLGLAWFDSHYGSYRRPSGKRLLELSSLVLVSVVSVWLSFNGHPDSVLIDYYLVGVPLFWATWRFGRRGTTLVVMFITLAGLAFTTQGHGFFSSLSVPLTIQVYSVQVFLIVAITAALVTSAALANRNKSAYQLAASQSRLRRVMDTVHDGVFECDLAYRYVVANLGYAGLFGLEPEHVIGRTPLQILPQWAASELMDNYKWVIESNQSLDTETEIPLSNGSITLASRLTPLTNTKGAVTGLVGVCRDVTEQKRVYAALRDSEARYRSLFEDSPIAVLEEDFSAVKRIVVELQKQGINDFERYYDENPLALDLCIQELHVLEVNQAALRLLDASDKAVIIGRQLALIGVDAKHAFLQQVIAISRGLTHCQTDGVSQTMNGDIRYVSIYWRVVPGHEETLDRVLVSMADTTALHQAKTMARENEERLRLVLEGTADGFWDWDLLSGEEFFSRRWAEMLGFKPEEIPPFRRSWQELVHPSDLPRATGALAEHFAGRTPAYRSEHRMRTRTGAYLWVADRGKIVQTDQSGRAKRMAGAQSDINTRKWVEMTLQESAASLRAAFECSPQALILLDLSLIVRLYNELARRLVQLIYAYDLSIGAEIARLIPSSEFPVFEEPLKRAFRGETLHIEHRIITGELYRWFEFGFTPVRNAGQTPTGVLLSVLDITERKRAEAALQASEKLYRTLVESVDDAIMVKDLDGRILAVNPEFEQVSGLRQEDVAGKSVFDLLPSDYARMEWEEEQTVLTRGDTVRREGPSVWPGPVGMLVQIHKVPLRDAGGSIAGLVAVSRDITARRVMEKALRHNEEQFRRVFEESPLGMAMLSLEGCFTSVNRRLSRMLGYAEKELGGQSYQRITHPADLILDERLMQRALSGALPEYSVEKRLIRKDGRMFYASLNITTVRNPAGMPQYALIMVEDISSRREMEERLQYTAMHDPLTHMPNRALFADRVAKAIEQNKRHQERRFTVLFMDMDRFKTVNDTWGHAVGDKFLIAVARVLNTCVRAVDTVARLGGDEFTVLLADASTIDGAVIVARRILSALSQPMDLDGITVTSSVSIGIAFSAGQYQQPEEIIKDADAAMYEAKAQGRNCYAVFGMTSQISVTDE